MIVRTALGALLLLILCACGSMPAPPGDHFYRIRPGTPSTSSAQNAAAPLVHVAPFIANALHAERAIAYAHKDGTTLEQYSFHYWVDSPRSMLQHALAEYLRAQGTWQIVTEPSVDAAYTIRSRIERFERQAGDGGDSGVVALRFEVYAGRESVPQLSRTYTDEVAARDSSVGAVTAAINSAVASVFEQFASDLRALP